MKKIIRLTETDLTNIVKRVIKENSEHSLEKLAKRIVLSRFDEVLSEMDSDDFGDEFEYADNFITYMLEGISDYEHYDELYDYIKDEYGEIIIDTYENDESEHDDDDFEDN